ncbi:MAG TPA: SDR family oxidoreductase [Candidatus Polarisedimenticolia bacterium]|nr:SDR family oxidoreductase [Candidatus Polarisedimenticolia bacterium]
MRRYTERLLSHFSTAFVLLALAASAHAAAATAAETAPNPAPTAARAKAGEARTVLVTGANRGLGLEFARQYHAAGWKVIGTARKPDEAADLKALGDGVRVLPLDVTKPESVKALAASLAKEPIDLLINNAGQGVGFEGGRLEKLKIDQFEQVLQVNTLGPVRVTQALLPNLRAGKGKTIVGISSGLGSIEWNSEGGFYGYRESKAALDMFMRSLAGELKSEGFICIALIPGWVKTDMGGPEAPLTPEESVTGMRKVLDGLKPADTGKFWSHDGTNVPW